MQNGLMDKLYEVKMNISLSIPTRSVVPALLCVFFVALSLVACGEDADSVNRTSMEIFASADELPACVAGNEGERVVVQEENAIRVCVDGQWIPMKASADKFSCKTEELNDGSGVKIVCNGDSIGVVLNGKDGSNGKDGKKGDAGAAGKDGENGSAGSGCSISEFTDTTVVLICGDSTMTIDLGINVPGNTAELDSEKIMVSFDSLVGFTQKGPFLKGSTVYLYELTDGRTLKQTNGNFTSNITQDDGRYKFNARELVSQYAMVIVDGYYRNEVTGGTSNATIRLRALTDMRRHNSVNVNLLTHLEFDRVYHLVTHEDSLTHEKMTVKRAKRRAQKEILEMFHIVLSDTSDAEDMDVFGSDDADAALLAISIMLQGNRTESDLVTLLNEISNELAKKGVWEGLHADSIKAKIADWVLATDWDKLRRNVESWGLSNGVGNFEKYIGNYMFKTYGMEPCGDEQEGEERLVNNALSVYSGKTFVCYNGTLVAKRAENKYLNPNVEYGKMIDPRDRKMYHTVKIENVTWMAENLDYADSGAYPLLKESSWCYDDLVENCDVYGRLYTWAVAMDSAGVFSTDGLGCGYSVVCATTSTTVQGLCPEGWHLPFGSEWYNLFYTGLHYSADMEAVGFENWPDATNGLGLSIMPGGGYFDGEFLNQGKFVDYWTASSTGTNSAITWRFTPSSYLLNERGQEMYNGMPVRCVKND